MASVIAKKKGNKLYYYLVESARVNGKPRIIKQVYLGTAEKLAATVQQQTAPVPIAATCRQLGLVGALWLAAKDSGVFDFLQSLWPDPRSGPSTAHYLLLAAIQRICEPGPKTEVADWYRSTVLESIWGFPPERFTSQAFWDCFDKIQQGSDNKQDDLDRAQIGLLGLWKDKQMVSHRLLAYDTTNFYTYIASTNDRNTLAKRGHNKQGRHNLRQVGLSYVLDGEYGLSLCHHVYQGNLSDSEEFQTSLPRLLRFLDENQIGRDTVTLVFDKGTAALNNSLQLDETGLGWISALPWNQTPQDFRETPIEQFIPLTGDQPGVQAVHKKLLVHGKERLCVIKYSASFAAEQLHSITTTLSKVAQSLRRLSGEIRKPGARVKESSVKAKINRWLAPQFIGELVHYELKQEDSNWRLQFDIDWLALNRLMTNRLGRTILLTNRDNWSPQQVVDGYSGQQRIERVFRGLKDGDWLSWGPMYHWTDSKIRIHAFYCMLGISLLNYVHAKAQKSCPQITIEQMKHELSQIQQFLLLYPRLGDKGPHRTTTIQSKLTLTQQLLAQACDFDQLAPTKGRV